jgi:hypothetical protein
LSFESKQTVMKNLTYPPTVCFGYQNEFLYELIYSPSKNETKPNKDVLLNIANS